MSELDNFKHRLREFFAFSSQEKWTRRQIADRIDKEYEKFKVSRQEGESDPQLLEK